MEYDNTNTGAIFNSNSDQLILVGTGSMNDEGETKRIAMIKDVMPKSSSMETFIKQTQIKSELVEEMLRPSPTPSYTEQVTQRSERL